MGGQANDSNEDIAWRRARREMVVSQLRGRGIADPHVLEAMSTLPREQFMTPHTRSQAYADRAVPLDCGQTISQPYIVARMTEALDIRPGHRVLEVGTGSGYQTAILARLGAHVWTVERIKSLSDAAVVTLADLNIDDVHYRVGDGSLGWQEAAPFDRILVTAGAPRLPQPLVDQSIEGGRIVIPIGPEGVQTLVIVQCHNGRTVETPLLPCRFVKLVGAEAWVG